MTWTMLRGIVLLPSGAWCVYLSWQFLLLGPNLGKQATTKKRRR
jgi:hypothetical protein